MATIDMPLRSPSIGQPRPDLGAANAERSIGQEEQHRIKSGPPVLWIAAYFLALASIAVIAVGGHFPWFTVAPATILSLIAYFRHVESTLERESSS